MKTVQDQKKLVLQIVVGVIIALSVVGNAYAVFNHYLSKTRNTARNEGWLAFATQLIQQSDGCRPVDVTAPDGKAERFINTKCLAAPTGTAAPVNAPAAAPAPAPTRPPTR